MSEEVQHVEETQVNGPGPVLKAARLEKGFSVEYIASQIHLKSGLITALEEDKYDPSISMTFIKGYLKLYARQVGVSEAQVLDGLDNLNMHKKEPAKLQSFSRRVAHQANDDKLMMVTYLILAVVVALVVVWWFQQSDNDKVDTLEAPTVQTKAVDSDNATNSQALNKDAVVDTTGSNQVNEPTEGSANSTLQTSIKNTIEANGPETVNGSTALVEPSLQSKVPADNAQKVENIIAAQTQVQTTQSADIENIAHDGLVDIVFQFADDCWVSVVDATGETIAVGVKVSGRVMNVSGKPPFEVILGAPSEVSIRYAGEDIDMSFLTPNSTAKFTLPLSL
ncbi:RodZ domain-containing protein [Paraglaciecola sp. 20A4]|uniref:RodZ domain-containing protein n=1 Tax=Paraglaciecola sp. 20A4 TaxID=2687288 RepID=UPI00140983B5|nr:RodZ domain-containing protein [Paraglaciecola sp. 20A4]